MSIQSFSFVLLSFLFGVTASAQQTIGVFQNDPGAYDGYTLFAPIGYDSTYLIDNCGRRIHAWTGSGVPGLSVYLAANGDLMRASKITSAFNGGGSGGKIERIDWNDNVVWSYVYSTSSYHQHHDFKLLPNGNVLLIAWDVRTLSEQIQTGRDTASLVANGIWSERLVELEPVGLNQANIVWEWNVFDHLIQDYDSTKSNYGIVGEHPELIDVNFERNGINGTAKTDWLHFNAVDYNAELDQIVVSIHSFDEIFIIDHSTTTAEAAGHAGGSSGKGGDLLYRWGNPQSYRAGINTDRQLFAQHDAHWIPNGFKDGGKIMVFNNGQGRPAGAYSTIEIIAPPLNASGIYDLTPNQAYMPLLPDWTYAATPPTDFYTANIGGASRLPNGNTLICEGASGHLFEIDSTDTQVWDYVNPVKNSGAAAQGATAVNNQIFKVNRYAPDFSGFQGKVLTPKSPLELNPLPLMCDTASVSITGGNFAGMPFVYQNPVSEILTFKNPTKTGFVLTIFTAQGEKIYSTTSDQAELIIPAAQWAKGLYFFRISGISQPFFASGKIWKE